MCGLHRDARSSSCASSWPRRPVWVSGSGISLNPARIDLARGEHDPGNLRMTRCASSYVRTVKLSPERERLSYAWRQKSHGRKRCVGCFPRFNLGSCPLRATIGTSRIPSRTPEQSTSLSPLVSGSPKCPDSRASNQRMSARSGRPGPTRTATRSWSPTRSRGTCPARTGPRDPA